MLLTKGLMFPSTSMQMLSAIINFLGLSILAHCISRRVGAEDLTSFGALRTIPWPRLCIILIFVDSWMFLFTSSMLIFGIGLELNSAVCSTAIYICIAFYATSKVLIYAYLMEKVHVVWSPAAGGKRFKSRVYIACFVTLSLYSIVIGLCTLVGKIHHFRDDGVCVIGLKAIASIPLLAYDCFINTTLTVLFLWPLFNSKRVLNPAIRRVAIRTLWWACAAAVALTTSIVNVLVLTILGGKELGWVCLGSCGSDVILNAFAIFWVTGYRNSPTSNAPPSERPHTSKTDAPLNPRRVTRFFDEQQPAGNGNGKNMVDYIPRQAPVPEISYVNYTQGPDNIPKPSILAKFASLFRREEQNGRRTQSIQVTVTTEYELDTHGPQTTQNDLEMQESDGDAAKMGPFVI